MYDTTIADRQDLSFVVEKLDGVFVTVAVDSDGDRWISCESFAELEEALEVADDLTSAFFEGVSVEPSAWSVLF